MQPLFSILTPSYNQASFLPRCLESVASQSGITVEHIVVDGASDDETVEILKRQASPNLRWVSEPDRGQTDALRKALNQATGRYMGWLNVDEYYEPSALRQVADAFERQPDAIAVYGDFRRVTSSGTEIRVNRQWRFDRSVAMLVTPIMQSCASFFSLATAREAGGFEDVTHEWAMDWDLYNRILAQPGPVVRLPSILGNFTMHGASKTSRGYDDFVSEVKMLRRSVYPGYSDRRIEALRRYHYVRMMIHMAQDGVLLDKLAFKLAKQHQFAAEYGTPGYAGLFAKPLRAILGH